jgi:hypothetical protein
VGDPLQAVVWYAVFLLSTTFHEAAHAWAARRGGDLTAYHGGQVSLDPRPHIRREPFGMVVLPVLSLAFSGFPFGFASTPYDPVWAERHPRRAAWMSLAGPAANLLLVVAAGLLARLGIAALPLLLPPALAERWRGFVRQPGLAWIGLVGVMLFFGELFRPVFLLAMGVLHGTSFG